MAEKLTAKKRKEDLNKLFAEYNRRLGILYSGYVKKLLALGYSEDVLENDALFNFDNFPVLKARLNEIFNDYLQNSMLCYKSGITSGVSLAYSHDNDALGQFSVLTDKALETARKTAAATFIANRLNAKKGLNLAQSVWNYCQQTKAEFEMAMSNVIADGLEKGTSAEEVGRRIRQYLNNPDMMYRRYHTVKVLKNGQKKDVVTWRRKRIINGRVRFVEEPLEHVGQGVYRSARKNALRVARTEINAAYHKARNGRWANEPFVIGQHIHISPQHDPDEDADICDELEGYYPKDFDWDSWHSQCMCTSDPVMISGEERKQFYKRMLNGEDMSGYVSPNSIKDVPNQYKRYIEANGDKIVDAFKRGKLAWHLANNKSYWLKYLDAAQRKQMGVKTISRREAIQEIAKARHAKRDVEAIKRKVEQRQKRLATERAYAHYGKSIMRYMDGIKDVDTSALKVALDAKDYANIYKEAEAFKEQGKKILSLSRLDNPILVARNYSMSEAIAVNSAVEARLARESAELLPRKRFLESEIRWVEEHKKHNTWKVAQDAYKKELRIVEKKIEIKDVADSVSSALAYASLSKSRKIKELASEMNRILTQKNVDLALARSKAQEINRKYQQLLKNKTKSPKVLKETAVNHETIKDLKKRLGTKFPKTLEHLEDAISEYEKNSRFYGAAAKTHKNEIEILMQQVFNEHDLGMNIKDSILEKVLNSKFMNTFETGSSGGYLGSTSTTGKISSTHSRLEAAHKLFGLPQRDLLTQQLARTEYEKYGNLLDHNILRSMQNNTARSYGNVEVRFKKDKVVATWTAGDSLGVRYQPSLVSDPKACSYDDFYNTPTSSNIQTANLVEFKKKHISTYLELQYHGQLTVDCIESITYPYDILDGSHDNFLKVAKEFKKKGASIYYIKGNALYKL
nr:MAG TPA: minor capsid protein [Caudoviricetes sp.]